MALGKGWVGFDLDGTLAIYNGWDNGRIGQPIPKMVEVLHGFIRNGVTCKLLTSRVASSHPIEEAEEQRQVIREWCLTYIGIPLEVTAEKDHHMILLFDDRAVGVEQNTGEFATERPQNCNKLFKQFDPWMWR